MLKRLILIMSMLFAPLALATPFQPQDLLGDGVIGDVDITLLCALSGSECVGGEAPPLSVIVTDGNPIDQVFIDGSTKVPLNFDPATGEILGAEFSVEKTLFGTLISTSTGSVLAGDGMDWFEVLAQNQNTGQWLPTDSTLDIGPAIHLVTWPTGLTGVLIDAVAGGEVIDPPTTVPLPPAVWLFGAGLLGLVGVGRRSNT